MCAITDAVRDVVNEKTGNKEVFSAFDVTKAVRAAQGGHVATHDVLKAKVHAMFSQGQMPLDYNKTLIGLDVGGGSQVQAFVYHPDGKNAYDHPLATKQTVTVTVPSDGSPASASTIPAPTFDAVDDGDEDEDEDSNSSTDSGILVITTVENRIEIPKQLLSKITPNSNGEYLIHAKNGKYRRRKPNIEGRVRVGTTYFGGFSNYNVSVDVGANEICISPS